MAILIYAFVLPPVDVQPFRSAYPKMNTKKATADKFTDLFDNNWSQHKSTIRTKIADDRSYDPSYSWEAKSDNPVSFSRLQATDMPVQLACPVTKSGAAMIRLDKHSGLEVLNVHQPSKTLNTIPLSVDQNDLNMSTDLRGNIPLCLAAAQSNQVVIVEEPVSFKCMTMQAPSFTTVTKPQFLVDAGPQCDKMLLNPTQRREISEFEKRERAANEVIHAATMARDRTRKQISGQKFHRGVLMVDSCTNEESEIYGARAAEARNQADYKALVHLERKGNLAIQRSSIATNGNILVPESVAPRVGSVREFQSKGGDVHTLTFQETHNRLFCRVGSGADKGRAQRLRDIDLGGKQYNIVSHAAIEQWPSKHIDRQENKQMAHPSQHSLEHSRNLQGSLRPV